MRCTRHPLKPPRYRIGKSTQIGQQAAGLKAGEQSTVKLAILGALRSITEKGHAISVAQHAYALLPCLKDDNVLVQRKVSALYRVLAEEGAAAMVARDVTSIMHCFEVTQAERLQIATDHRVRTNPKDQVTWFHIIGNDWNGLNPTLPWRPVVFLSMAPLEALSAIAGAGEGTAVARVIERLLSGLRRGVRCIPESLQNHEITNSNLLVSIQVYSRIVSHFIPKIPCLSMFIGSYRSIFSKKCSLREVWTLLLAAKCRDHRSKIRNSTCATLAAIARGGGKELLGSLGLSAEAESEVLTSVPWLPMVTPMLPQLFHGTSLLLNVER